MSESGPEDGRQDDGVTEHGNGIDPGALATRIVQATESDDVKRLLAVREVALGRSVEAVADEFGWSERRLNAWLVGSAEGQPEDGDGDGWWASRVGPVIGPSLVAKLVIVGLLTALLVALLQPGLVVGLRMEVVGTYAEVLAEPVPVDERAELTIATEDVAYLNRIFVEQDVEVGYCGLVDGDGSVRPWLAQLGSPTTSSVELSVRNCPTGRYEELALMHTHPNGDPRVSAADRSSLRVRGVDYVCVQHGPVTAAVGETTSYLRCYRSQDETGSVDALRRVPVRVVG